MTDLQDFTVCSWQTGGLPRGNLAALGQFVAERHPEAGLVQTCQRIEAFSLAGCRCDAPVRRQGLSAVLHLASLAAGLESAVLGEYQVLGQVRSGVAPLRRHVAWIDDALAAARKLRAEANLRATTGGLLSLGLNCAQVEAGGRLLVLGAGAAGRDVARHGLALGFSEVWLASRRRPEPAVPGVAGWIPFAHVASAVPFDVVAGCLGSAAEALSAADLPAASVYVDLGSPSNFGQGVAPSIGLQSIIAGVEQDPAQTARRGELHDRLALILEERLASAAEDASSPVGLIRLAAERVRHREAKRIARLHPHIAPEAVESITRGLVNQLLHAPSARLRELDDPELARRVAGLFAPLEATL